jgi:hypothetical protein
MKISNRTMNRYLVLWGLMCFSIHSSFSQVKNEKLPKGLQFYLSSDSVSYIKASVLGQFWLRYNRNNPGSTVNGTEQGEAYDIGIRRMRFSLQSQITQRFFLYTQVGLNNLNSLSARKQGLFLHDAAAEIKVYKQFIDIGFGLNGWNGTSRFSSSAISSILCMDLPVIHETTNDVTDQFGRKFGIYAKGKIFQFDYRFSVSKPFPVQSSINKVDEMKAGEIHQAYFSKRPQQMNSAGYLFYQFFDKESNHLPYMTGSYLGAKKILNLGTGFQFQKDAMWYRNELLDTISAPLQQFGIDLFYDSYLSKTKGNAISAYAAFLNYYFGPNYIRNVGVMNVANGVNEWASFNGTGNSVPLIGTGSVVYAQVGYKFKNNLLKSWGTIQPYASASYSKYQKMSSPVQIYSVGINWLMLNNQSKLSIDYQSRPVFSYDGMGHVIEDKASRRGQVVLQYQIFI